MSNNNILSWYHLESGKSLIIEEKLYNEHYPDGKSISFGTVLNFPENFNITKKSLKNYANKVLFECEEKESVFNLIDEFFDKSDKDFMVDLKRREEMEILRSLIREYVIIEKGWIKLQETNMNDRPTFYFAEVNTMTNARKFVKEYIYDRGFSPISNIIINIIGKVKFLPRAARPSDDPKGYAGKYENIIKHFGLDNHQSISDFVKGVNRTSIGRELARLRG